MTEPVSLTPAYSPALQKRIEELGKLNDRRLICAANKDVDGLRVIAAEYAGRKQPMLQTANVIYKQIEIMIREVTR